MISMNAIRTVATRAYGRGSLLLMKHGPTILVGAGVVGIGAMGVMIYKAARKQDAYLAESDELLKKIHDARKFAPESYSEEKYNEELSRAYINRAGRFVKLYGPAIAVGALSVGCILKSHFVLKGRNVALIAAYKVLDDGFRKYRARVVTEFGPEVDTAMRHGIVQDEVTKTCTAVDENGKVVESETKEVLNVLPKDGPSIYAREFNEQTSSEYRRDPNFNKDFLILQQRIFNEKLKRVGHVFLNDVYDALGLERSPAGQVVGWVYGGHREPGKNGLDNLTPGDDHIDFGLMDVKATWYRNINVNDTIGQERWDFMNGYISSILLDFNVDGVIYDKI